jgi:hypothetical protein
VWAGSTRKPDRLPGLRQRNLDMNYKVFWPLLIVAALSARGDALRPQSLSPDAKWLIHIDLDHLRQSKLGEYLMANFVGPKLAQLDEQLQTEAPKLAGVQEELHFSLSNVVQHLNSLTAFGTDFKTGPDSSGVLLLNCDAKTQKALEGMLVGFMLANTNGPIRKLEGDGPSMYSFAGQVTIAPQAGGPIVISKSPDQIDAVRERLSAKGPAPGAIKMLTKFPAVSNAFFFVGVAEAPELPTGLPAQAKVLQMADGGRVAMGERDQDLFLDLALRGKTPEVGRQIQQVVEGMVALVSLGQPDNQDVVDLAQRIKVSSANELVNIHIEYPTAKVIARVTDEMGPKHKDKAVRKPSKAKAKGKAKRQELQPEADEVKPDSDSAK